MTQAHWNDDRLDRLASVVAANAEAIRESNEHITALEHLAQSNSRIIQAILDAMAEAADERRELREATLRPTELTFRRASIASHAARTPFYACICRPARAARSVV